MKVREGGKDDAYLPVFFFNVDVILFDTFKGKFFFLDQNSDWFSHESLGDIENFSWHGGGQKHDLFDFVKIMILALERTWMFPGRVRKIS